MKWASLMATVISAISLGLAACAAMDTGTDSGSDTESAADTATNNTPKADDLNVYAAPELTASFTVTGTDADGDPLSYSAISFPVNGSLGGTPPNFTYTPTATAIFTGDTFTFEVIDGNGGSDSATVTILPAVEPVHVGGGGFITRVISDPTNADSS